MKYFSKKALEDLRRDIRRAPSGFRYGFVRGIFREDVYAGIARGFPDVKAFRPVDMMAGGGHKRFHVGETYYSGTDYGAIHQFSKVSDVWQAVLAEAASEEFMALLRDATGIRFNSLCNFGFAYGDEGCMQEPHLDGSAMKKKAVSDSIACLLCTSTRRRAASRAPAYTTSTARPSSSRSRTFETDFSSSNSIPRPGTGSRPSPPAPTGASSA